MNRASKGTRWIDGRLFVLRSVHPEKEEAQRIAKSARDGTLKDCACCPIDRKGERHYARVVRYDWHDVTLEDGTNLNDWAVYTFPKD